MALCFVKAKQAPSVSFKPACHSIFKTIPCVEIMSLGISHYIQSLVNIVQGLSALPD
jgi:hypothetical protein